MEMDRTEHIDNSSISFRPIPALHWQRLRTLSKNGYQKKMPEDVIESHFNAIGLQLIINEGNNGTKRILITGDTLFPILNDMDKDEWFAYEKKSEGSPYIKKDMTRQLGWTPFEVFQNQIELIKKIETRCKECINTYKSLEKMDVICLHLGSLEDGFSHLPEEFHASSELFKKRHDAKYCYNGFHLGMMGTIRLTELLIQSNWDDPQKGFDSETGLIVLTEFGEELLGNRQNICCAFSEILKEITPQYKINEQTIQLMRLSGIDNAILSRLEPFKSIKCKTVNPFATMLRQELSTTLSDEHCRIISDASKKYVNSLAVLPSEITLRLRLNNAGDDLPPGIFCSYCGKVHAWKETSAIEGPGEILTFCSKGPESNRYCHNCVCW
jgi:hypothetical protein